MTLNHLVNLVLALQFFLGQGSGDSESADRGREMERVEKLLQPYVRLGEAVPITMPSSRYTNLPGPFATTEEIVLPYNFSKQTSDNLLSFILLHELGHRALGHPHRGEQIMRSLNPIERPSHFATTNMFFPLGAKFDERAADLYAQDHYLAGGGDPSLFSQGLGMKNSKGLHTLDPRDMHFSGSDRKQYLQERMQDPRLLSVIIGRRIQ